MTDEAPRCIVCDGPMPRHGGSPIYCTSSCKRTASARRARNRKMLGEYSPPPPPSHCAQCRKAACPTEATAKAAKRAIEVSTGRTNEVRYYQCSEGWWHWTRMDATLDGFRARADVAE